MPLGNMYSRPKKNSPMPKMMPASSTRATRPAIAARNRKCEIYS